MDTLKVDGGALYQWDTGRRVVVKPAEGCTVNEVHFANPDGPDAYIVELKTEGDRILAPIPNILLQGPGHIHVFAAITTADGRRTICDKIFNIRPRQKPADYVYTETEVYNIKTVLENALREAKESGEFDGVDGKDGYSEWDYVITSLDDFTTEKLATMHGRVLVKGVNLLPNPNVYYVKSVVAVHGGIKLIKFIDSTIYADVTGENTTRIVGFTGDTSQKEDCIFEWASLRGFGAVEQCRSEVELYNCQNIIHSQIRNAYDCTNLQDIYVIYDNVDATDSYLFQNCTLIDGVQFKTYDSWHEGMGGYEEAIIEFNNCKHLSNIHKISAQIGEIQYNNCSSVDGDTCDDYYTEEDEGKVRGVSTTGEKSLISVYSQEEIDDKIGDIDTVLDNIIAIQEGLVGTISFTIDGTEYTALSGMTWFEWVNSQYNTDGVLMIQEWVGDVSLQFADTGDMLINEETREYQTPVTVIDEVDYTHD